MDELLSWLPMMKEGDHVKVERGSFSHHGIVVVSGELVLDFVSFGGSKDDGTGGRQWISKQCKSILMLERLNITNVSLDDKRSARVWGHCPFPECKANTLRQLRWKADQVVLTCFRNNVHHHQELVKIRSCSCK